MNEKIGIPVEVWGMIFRYLRLLDLVEVSAVCKQFHALTHRMFFYVKKLDESRCLITDRHFQKKAYENTFVHFYDGLVWDLEDIVSADHLSLFKHELFTQTIIQ